MTKSVFRIVMAMVIMGATPVVWGILFIVIERNWYPSDREAMIASTLICWIPLFTCWIVLWRRGINWTRSRRLWTGAAMFLAIAVWIGSMVLIEWTVGRKYGFVFGPMLGALTWIVLTCILWRETPSERMARLGAGSDRPLPCPKCQYNMTGLQQARCPECGTQYTLDELLASAMDRRFPDADLAD